MNTDDLYRLLRTGHAQAQGIVDTLSDPLLVLDSNLNVQTASLSFFETFGVDRYETIGQPLYNLGDGQWDIPELRTLLDQVIPKATTVLDYEVEQDFPHIGRRTMLLSARKLHDASSASHSLLLVFVDATDLLQREAANDLLFGELRHRMKNLLGVTRALARQTAIAGRTAEEYRDAFLGRFEALILADELSFGDGVDTGLLKLLQELLKPYGLGRRVMIEPSAELELDPAQIRPLCLVIHELATNAAKYGALSSTEGVVTVSCEGIGNGERLWRKFGLMPCDAKDGPDCRRRISDRL